MKQLLLYTKDADLSEDDLKLIKGAGFIPIAVKNFDAVKTMGVSADISECAILAIHRADDKTGPKGLFGRLLAERLSGEFK